MVLRSLSLVAQADSLIFPGGDTSSHFHFQPPTIALTCIKCPKDMLAHAHCGATDHSTDVCGNTKIYSIIPGCHQLKTVIFTYMTPLFDKVHTPTHTVSASAAVTFSLPDSHGHTPILWDTDTLLSFTSFSTFLVFCSLSWGWREVGPEVRQMKAGDTPIHSQSQVSSCGSVVMEKSTEGLKIFSPLQVMRRHR